MELAGKVALVTGASQGIGKAYCQALVKNGVKIAICDINEKEGSKLEKELNESGRNSIFLSCDVTNESQFENCFKKTISEFGRLDVVVNNAGILNDSAWEKEVDVNLCGAIRGSLLGLKYMKKGSTIVLTTSYAGIHRDSLFPVYSATKGGANYFVRSLGSPSCYRSTGIRILGIAPSLTNTPIVGDLLKGTTLLPNTEELCKERATNFYMQKPEAVADCLIHILKEDGPSASVWLVENDKWRKINYEKLIE